MSEKLNITSDKIAYKQIMADLESLYINEFYTCENKCIHYAECLDKTKEKAKGKTLVEQYNSDYTARVGQNFPLIINGREIRVVIVGKEGTKGEQQLRLPTRLIVWKDEKRVNRHYQETYKILCEMLNYNWKYDEKCEKGKTKDNVKYCYKQDAVLTVYTLTNLYRCAFKDKEKINKNTTLDNPSEQTKNCLEILRQELKILKPAILVLQNNVRATDIYPDAVQPADYTANDKLYYSATSNCHIIKMCHPAVRNSSYQNKSVQEFREAVKYLRSKGFLPTEDTTDCLNNLDKQKNT